MRRLGGSRIVAGRWAALFADLDGEADAAEAADLRAEVLTRTKIEHARLTLADRLRAHEGVEVTVTVGAGTLRGRLADAAPEWLLVDETLVAATAVLAVQGLGPNAGAPESRPRKPLPLGVLLRMLADRGDEVTCTFADGRTVRGTIGRVGADHVDIGDRVVPYAALATVRPG
jgi:hypothetical protein